MRSQRGKGKGGKEISFHESSIWEQPMTAKEEGAPCKHLGSSWSFVPCLAPSSPQIPEPQEITFKRDVWSHPCPIFKAPGVSFMLTEQSKNASVWHSMSVPNLLSLTLHHELPLPATQKSSPFPECTKMLQDLAFACAGPYPKSPPCALSPLRPSCRKTSPDAPGPGIGSYNLPTQSLHHLYSLLPQLEYF